MVTQPTIQVATFGMWDSLLLMVLALVVFGPRRLPEIGRQIGKLMYEVRKASNDFKFQMEEELRLAEEADRRKKEEERQRTLAAQSTIEAPAIAAESPYPGEEQYPVAVAPATLTTEETQPEETVLQAQPPSTGEQVQAARPASEVTSTVTEQAEHD